MTLSQSPGTVCLFLCTAQKGALGQGWRLEIHRGRISEQGGGWSHRLRLEGVGDDGLPLKR